MSYLARTVALLLLTFPSLPAADKWFYLASPNFEIYTNTGRSRARDTLARFEQMHEVLATFFGEQKFPEPVRVFLFDSIKAYEPFALNDPQRTAGYFFNGQYRSHVVLRDVDNYDLRLIFRSYAYLFLQRALPGRPPFWILEGASDYYSTVTNYAGKLTAGAPVSQHLREVETGGFLDLETLFAATHLSPEYTDRRLRRRFSAECWGLVHMLLMHDDYRERSKQFFGRISQDGDSIAAFRAVYGTPLDKVLADLKFYVRGENFKIAVYPFKMPKLEREDERAEQVDRDARAALAELLLERQLWDQARDYLAGLSADYPSDADIAGLRAVEAMRRDAPDMDAAGRSFQAALEGGSESAWTHYNYADYVRQTGGERTAIEEAYRKAGEANRNLTWPHLYLGQVAMNRRQYGGAMSYFIKVIKAHPRNVSAYRLAALAYHGLGAQEQAFQMIELAEARAGTEREIAEVREARTRVETRPEPLRPADVVELWDEPALIAANAESIEPEPAPEAPPDLAAEQTFDQVDDVELETRVLRRDDSGNLRIVAKQRGEKLKPSNSRLEGNLVEVVCLGPQARFVVEAGDQRFPLAIVDPSAVTLIRGEKPAAFDFQCGPQEAERVEVEFDPKVPEGVENAAGVLLFMRFLNPQ